MRGKIQTRLAYALAVYLLIATTIQAKQCTTADLKYGYSQCTTASQTRNVYFYYDSKDQCEKTSDPIPSPILNLKCNVSCQDGYYLGADFSQNSSTCSQCPQNTYSTRGIMIDGLMGDWEDIQNQSTYNLPIEFDCYYQDDELNWQENMKCTPWKATSKSLKAWDTEAYNTVSAFELTITAYLKTNGTVEFKYRKDSRSSYITNGEFKFAVNNVEIMVDNSYQNDDWTTHTYHIKEPGMFSMQWIYSKYSEEYVTESMSAEIEYIKITGLEYAAKECLKCKKGWSQAGSDRCSVCGANSYIDTNSQECKACPEGYFSFPGSVARSSCQQMRACTKADILTTYGQCKEGTSRTVEYSWIQPSYCNQNDTSSVTLPTNTTTTCRQCGRGEFYSASSGKCQYCADGTYNDKDHHLQAQTGQQVTECGKCIIGTAAVKVLEYEDFEEIPNIFKKQCTVIDSTMTSQTECDKFFGWRPENGKLDSGTGISGGIKSSLTTAVKIVDEVNGNLAIVYSTQGFTDNERLAVYINGVRRYYVNQNTDNSSLSIYLEAGDYKIEISFESNATSTNLLAQVQISKIILSGSNTGGAVECKECSDGFIASGKDFRCIKCQAGYQTNEDQSECQECPQGYFNPKAGGECKKCPQYTEPSKDKAFCELYDEVVTSNGYKYHPHILEGKEVCVKKQSENYCNENQMMGPIFPNISKSGIHTGDIYFVAQHQKFDMKTYEYHETKNSEPKGYIFALFSLKNESVADIKNILGDTQLISQMDSECMNELKSLKVKKNLGSQIKSFTDEKQSGYTVAYEEGDICDTDTNEKYTSEIRYVCNSQSKELGWPEFIEKVGNCHYVFQWKSEWACSQCRLQEVKTVESPCLNGVRTIANVPFENNCIIVNSLNISNNSVYVSPNSNPRLQFVNAYNLYEACYLSDDLKVNPVLQGLVIMATLLFICIFGAMIWIYCKYKSLKIKYSRLSENDGPGLGGEIEMQTR